MQSRFCIGQCPANGAIAPARSRHSGARAGKREPVIQAFRTLGRLDFGFAADAAPRNDGHNALRPYFTASSAAACFATSGGVL